MSDLSMKELQAQRKELNAQLKIKREKMDENKDARKQARADIAHARAESHTTRSTLQGLLSGLHTKFRDYSVTELEELAMAIADESAYLIGNLKKFAAVTKSLNELEA